MGDDNKQSKCDLLHVLEHFHQLEFVFDDAGVESFRRVQDRLARSVNPTALLYNTQTLEQWRSLTGWQLGSYSLQEVVEELVHHIQRLSNQIKSISVFLCKKFRKVNFC